MFESLKSRLKKVVDKAPEELEVVIKFEDEEEPIVEEISIEECEPPPIEVVEILPETKPLSRKEQLKIEKQNTKRNDSLNITSVLSDTGKKIQDDPLDDLLDELEMVLLESDVAYSVVEEIILGTRENLIGKKHDREYTLNEVVEIALKDSIRNVLKVNEFDFLEWINSQTKPIVIMFVGINGAGKTTVIAKIAKMLQNYEKSVILASCDTFRAGAIEQLTIHANNLGVKIVKQSQNADPAAVAYDAVEHAKAKRRDVVLIDTAGRMQTNNNLIEEMKKIVRISKPDLKIFVGDSLAGNDAIEQAKVFNNAIGIDAIILTKIDTDAKGGAALSIAHTIGKPIAFVCNGQEYDNIERFDTEWMLNRLFE